MKFVRFDNDQTGLLVDRGSERAVLDVAASLDGFARTNADEASLLRSFFSNGAGADWAPLIESWERAREPLQALADKAQSGSEDVAVRRLDSVRLRPPLPARRSRVFAFGSNFADHIAKASAATGLGGDGYRSEAKPPPSGFFVIPGTIIGQEETLIPPPDAQKLDYEAEVGVVLATGGRDVEAADVHIWGFTGFNDFSIRDPHLGLSELDKGPLSFALQKNFHGGNACGPCLVVDELDAADLGIECRVNGEVRQSGSTRNMIRPFAEIAEFFSHYLSLEPGDMILSGTPQGTAMEGGIDGPFLRPGDVVEVDITGAGVLRNHVGAST
jgi:2-keto-4-pentenoate hydratase/2-oxohepta-3-ene-1,7-dioic acid hydratase in catechol pathway